MSRILVKTTDMPREKWLEYRRSGIGGSDAAVIVGLSPYRSQIELWADKTGRLPDKEDSEAMRVGRDLEEYVARRFCEATEKRVRRRNAIFQHDTYDFITANVDREIVGENAGLECKTTSAFAKSDFENGEIPPYYYCQCCHYMNVMGYEKMYLAVLVMGRAFYWYEIKRDENECAALLNAEIEFWNKHIIPDSRPMPDGSDSAQRTLEALYNEQRDNVITMFEQEQTAAELTAIKAQIKVLEVREKLLKQNLINALGGNTDGLTENYKLSWREQSKTTLDSKSLKRDYPKIYEQFAKTSTSKVFRISERK